MASGAAISGTDHENGTGLPTTCRDSSDSAVVSLCKTHAATSRAYLPGIITMLQSWDELGSCKHSCEHNESIHCKHNVVAAEHSCKVPCSQHFTPAASPSMMHKFTVPLYRQGSLFASSHSATSSLLHWAGCKELTRRQDQPHSPTSIECDIRRQYNWLQLGSL